MKILNIHERRLNARPEQVGAVINTLSSRDDRLWPRDKWPPMKFDSELRVGASGGHGPIRYHVSEYVPGRRIEFNLRRPGLAMRKLERKWPFSSNHPISRRQQNLSGHSFLLHHIR